MVKTFSEFIKLFRVAARKMFLCQTAINQSRCRFSHEVIGLKHPQRRRQNLQSGQRLQYKEEQVADEECLQRRHERLSPSEKKIGRQLAGSCHQRSQRKQNLGIYVEESFRRFS